MPVAYWAGNTIFDRRTGVLAAVGVGACPFLNYYAQETRMYSLVVVLSLLASASFVLAFLHGRRGHLIALGAWMTLLLYTHAWGLYLAVAMACAWLVLWRRGRVAGRDGLLVAGAVLLLYAPWIPTLISQAQHTAAPWSDRPTAMYLLVDPVHALRRGRPLARDAAADARRARRAAAACATVDGAIRVLAGIAVGTALAAWLGSQIEPAWANRYFAVLLGPLVLALAAVLARGARLTAVALVGRRGDLARQRPDRGAQQRAHGRRRGHAGDPAGRRRRVHPARAGAGALALPAAAACSTSRRSGWSSTSA